MVWKRIHEGLCDLLFPPRCPLCDEVMDAEESSRGICEECKGKLRYIGEPRCMKCGALLAEAEEEYCRSCSVHRHFYDRGFALYEYPTVRTSVYRFKYSGRKEYAGFFGKELARMYGGEMKRLGVEAVIPIPMHASKRRQRGYDQAQALAKVFSDVMGIPLQDKLVRRSRKTRPMKYLSAKERQINLKNAFLLTQDDVKLKRVVLVDDIYTTGSTIDSVSAILKGAGVTKVYFLALAIGNGV